MARAIGGRRHARLKYREIELDKIVCDSTFAQALGQRVLEDKARVSG